jgi:hypothetical protein
MATGNQNRRPVATKQHQQQHGEQEQGGAGDAHWYEDLIDTRTRNGNLYALTVILISQVIFLNLHFILGATLTCLAMVSLVGQAVISSVALSELRSATAAAATRPPADYRRLRSVLFAHFVFNHIIMIAFLPFLLWTVVLMYERAAT